MEHLLINFFCTPAHQRLQQSHHHADRRLDAGRDGNRLPARAHPGRVDALRDAQAHRRAADRGRQYLSQSAWRRGAGQARAGAQHERRKAGSTETSGRFPPAAREGVTRHAEETSARGDRGQKRV